MRIVSLLPSTTEILFAIGAGDEVVGVTFECDYPPAARSRTVVSTSTMPVGLSAAEIDAQVRAMLARGEDLYRLHEGALRELAPELVVTQDLCAVCAVDLETVDAAMAHLGCDGAVLSIDPGTLDEVLTSITTIGEATGHLDAAIDLVASLRARLAAVSTAIGDSPRPRVVVLEWTEPPFSAGHWVPDMVAAAGGEDQLGVVGGRSVQVRWPDVDAAGAEVVVVSPCGYHLGQAIEVATRLLDADVLPRDVAVWAVDADAAFVRPGPRLVDGVEALAAVLHPEKWAPRPDLAAYVGRTSANTKPSRSTTSPTETAIG